jgi:type IV secretory pathway TrbF-like protein
MTWILLALLALAIGAIAVQTQRYEQAAGQVTGLTEQVRGLEVQLAAAHLQLQTYESQLDQVRDAVADVAERIAVLQGLVNDAPGTGPFTDEQP